MFIFNNFRVSIKCLHFHFVFFVLEMAVFNLQHHIIEGFSFNLSLYLTKKCQSVKSKTSRALFD